MQYGSLCSEINKITELTKVGTLKWVKVPSRYLLYQTCNTELQLVISCNSPDCRIKIGNRTADISCEVIFELCSEIVKQLRNEQSQMDDTVAMLRSFNASLDMPAGSEIIIQKYHQ